MDAQKMLLAAGEHHRGGRLPQAEQACRAILAEQPENADALHLLGVLANQTGHPKEAGELISKAIAIRPVADYYTNLAKALFSLGEHERAISALEQVIAMNPRVAAAHGNLGTLLQNLGKGERAAESFQRAAALQPDNPKWPYNLGNVLVAARKHGQAAEAFEICLRLDPANVAALNSLGNALHGQGRFGEAAEKIRQALKINPTLLVSLNNLGSILISLGQLEEAADVFRQAVSVDRRATVAYNNLGGVLLRLGRYHEAIETYRQGLALRPDWPEVHNNLSVAHRSVGEVDAAIAAAQAALRQRPDYAFAGENLALALLDKGEADQAMDILARLVGDHPNESRILSSYGGILSSSGRLEEAMACFRRASEAKPSDYHPASNYLFVLQFQSDDPDLLLTEHRKWDARYATPLKNEIRPFIHDRSRDRRLRIGYVSPDFRRNVMSLMTSPLLPHHDHERFEIYCYSGVVQPDGVTARLRTHADVWRSITFVSDADAGDMIRADGIDILVDMTMHMNNCRPLLFARKPAPIQVAWAYPGTTGLSTMDYRLTDPYIDPPQFDVRYTEKSLRLQETFWGYDPYGMSCEDDEALPEPGELPASTNGFVTFGCLNDFSKINIGTLQRWGRLMQSVERSHLRLLAPRGRCQARILGHLQPFGVTADRIDFVSRQPRAAYLAEYQRIDLCLDTLPYNGHCTSLDAFWMGVPVLTQIGRTLVGRAGFSQLTNLQLPDFCANNDDQFMELGRRWSSDLAALAEIRRTLRERMSSSPLMDGSKFARRMESAYRQMWEEWIEQG